MEFSPFLNSYNGLLKIDVPYYYYGIRKWGLRLGLEQVKYFNHGKPTSKLKPSYKKACSQVIVHAFPTSRSKDKNP